MSSDPDSQFFTQHSDRQAHIRMPQKQMVTNRQRGTRVADECEGEFWSLGEHARDRRRIIAWRIPKDNPFYDRNKPQILKIPFLAFADETIEDTDEILLPIVHEIMQDALKKWQR
jgi:hypothetical protein